MGISIMLLSHMPKVMSQAPCLAIFSPLTLMM